jgi:pyruvate dehydrogenase E2 component (dihydrolipoamide acetyltransferase)
MATIIRMPSILAGANEAAISKWLVKAGDQVEEGAPFAELETEKAVVEYNSEVSGVIGRLVLAEGQSGEIGAPIAVLLAAGETEADIDAALGQEAGSVAAPAETSAPAEQVVAEAPAAHTATEPAAAPAASVAALQEAVSDHSGNRVFASPLARKLARERGLDVATLRGTGPGGRIVRHDVENAPTVAASAASANPVAPAAAPAGEVTSIPHTGMRKAIARRLTESKSTVPHFYLTTECKVDALLALREQINAHSPVRVSVNDLVVKAVALAFVDVPEANVTWTDTATLRHSSADISVAVSTEGGLVTPVVRSAEAKTITAVSAEIKDLAARAQDKRLRQDELEGGTFTISNLGMYGTLEFAAILNPPQSGILAVGAAKPQPVVVDGQLAIATVMRCTLSADHRAIDGALAAQWLAAFTQRIENPVSLLL